MPGHLNFAWPHNAPDVYAFVDAAFHITSYSQLVAVVPFSFSSLPRFRSSGSLRGILSLGNRCSPRA